MTVNLEPLTLPTQDLTGFVTKPVRSGNPEDNCECSALGTNRWGERNYYADIEAREDGGTPGFLQAIRAALVIDLKNSMGTAYIAEREEELLGKALSELRTISNLHILADDNEKRIGVISLYAEDIHHNLFVRLLNDRFGVQVRGGCSCAGTYGHYLLHVTKLQSEKITEMINHGDLSEKPGWVRISFHPTMTDKELDYILGAVKSVMEHRNEWVEDYYYDNDSGEFIHKRWSAPTVEDFQEWFEL